MTSNTTSFVLTDNEPPVSVKLLVARLASGRFCKTMAVKFKVEVLTVSLKERVSVPSFTLKTNCSNVGLVVSGVKLAAWKLLLVTMGCDWLTCYIV